VDTGESTSLAGGAVLRQARPGDEDGILDCVRGLAEYEKDPGAVQTTAQDLRRVLFEEAARAPAFLARLHELERS